MPKSSIDSATPSRTSASNARCVTLKSPIATDSVISQVRRDGFRPLRSSAVRMRSARSSWPSWRAERLIATRTFSPCMAQHFICRQAAGVPAWPAFSPADGAVMSLDVAADGGVSATSLTPAKFATNHKCGASMTWSVLTF